MGASAWEDQNIMGLAAQKHVDPLSVSKVHELVERCTVAENCRAINKREIDLYPFCPIIQNIKLVGDEMCHLRGALSLDDESAAGQLRASQNSCRVADAYTLSAMPLEQCVKECDKHCCGHGSDLV
jgi:hypothetical protein